MTWGPTEFKCKGGNQLDEGPEQPLGVGGSGDTDGVVDVGECLVVAAAAGVAAATMTARVSDPGGRVDLGPENPRNA